MDESESKRRTLTNTAPSELEAKLRYGWDMEEANAKDLSKLQAVSESESDTPPDWVAEEWSKPAEEQKSKDPRSKGKDVESPEKQDGRY